MSINKVGWPADKIIRRKVSSLVPYARNARTHSAVQVDQIAASINEWGWTVPILIDPDGGLIAGHGRILAAQKLGIDEVPCMVAEGWSDAKKRAYIIADNKLALNARWDDEMLALELKDLKDFDIDLLKTGITANELTRLLSATPMPFSGLPDMKKKGSGIEEFAPTDYEREQIGSRHIIVEFSGGMDSSTAAFWVKHFFPENQCTLLFADLGADFIGFRFHLNLLSAALDAPIHIEIAPRNIIDLILEQGKWPHWMGPYCHTLLHQPIDRFIKSFNPDEIIIVRGSHAKERKGHSGAHDARLVEIPRLPGYRFFNPIYFGQKGCGEAILAAASIPKWAGYEFGLQRTACRVCPGQTPYAYSAIRANYPDVWGELLELEKRVGIGWWRDTSKGKGRTVTDLADEGQTRFEKGGYRRRIPTL